MLVGTDNLADALTGVPSTFTGVSAATSVDPSVWISGTVRFCLGGVSITSELVGSVTMSGRDLVRRDGTGVVGAISVDRGTGRRGTRKRFPEERGDSVTPAPGPSNGPNG